MATLADIAKRAGVSKSTASRVLNGKSDLLISEETVERVQHAAQELGYRPNRLAKALATGRSHVIELLLPVLDRPYYSTMLGHIERVVRANGYDLMVTCVRPGADLGRMTSIPADGIILCELFGIDSTFYRKRASQGCAVVALSGHHPDICDGVYFNMLEATTHAVRHLIVQGARRIGYLTVPPTIRPDFPRWQAYKQVLEESGLEPLPLLIDAERRQLARSRIIEALEEHPDLDGLFCHTDHLALGALRGILDTGRSVPHDIVLVGCDGTEEGEYCEPPISTICLPYQSMVEDVWRLLQARMTVPDAPFVQHTHEAIFLPRRSSLRYSVSDPEPGVER